MDYTTLPCQSSSYKKQYQGVRKIKKSFNAGGGILTTLGIHNVNSFNQYSNVSSTMSNAAGANAIIAGGSFTLGQDF